MLGVSSFHEVRCISMARFGCQWSISIIASCKQVVLRSFFLILKVGTTTGELQNFELQLTMNLSWVDCSPDPK